MRTTTEIASYHGAKTVSAGHLRASIMGNEKFDFLKEIVEGVPDLPTEQVKKPVVGSLSEGDEVRVKPSSSSLSAGRLTGEATRTTGKRDRPQKAPAPAMNVGEDDEPALKAVRGTGNECGQRGSLEEGVIGLSSSIAQVVGTLAEDDDYDDL